MKSFTVKRFAFAAMASSSTLALSALSAPVAAQTSTPEAESRIEDIVVTATRRAESLQRTAVSVTALSADSLRQSGITDTRLLQEQTPSLQLVPSGGGNPVSLQVSLRGQFQNAINITNDPSVALYIDDIYVGKDAGNITDITDMERIEVLKGPQGTLFGRNSTGGAIRYMSKRPDPTAFAGSVRAGYGNFDDIKAEAMLNVPMSDKAAIRYAGTFRRHDGYTTTISATVGAAGVTPVRTRETDDLRTQLHRLSLLLQPSDNLSVNLIGSYHKRTVHGYLARALPGDLFPLGRGTSPQAQADYYTGLNNANDALNEPVDPFVQAKGYLLSGAVDWDIDDSTQIKLISGYLKNKTTNAEFDVDGTVAAIAQSTTFQDFKQFSTELQLSGKALSDKLDYVTGLYYFRESGVDYTDARFQTAFGGVRSTTDGFGVNRSYSAFAHLRYHIGEATTLQGGARYTIDKKALRVTARQGIAASSAVALPCAYTGGADVNLASCRFTPDATFKFWSYLIGVEHQFSDGVFGYLKSSRTQRSGGQQIRSTNGDIRPFRPETITDYEIGLKLDLLDRHVRFNIAAFYGDYKDVQFTAQPRTRAPTDPANCSATSTCTGPTTTVVTNTGTAKVPGGEVEMRARFGGFGLDLGASYVKVDFDGTIYQQAYTPKTQYNAGVSYEHDLGIGMLNGRVGYFRRGKVTKSVFQASRANPLLAPLPAYGIWNARLGLVATNGFDIAFHVENISKKKYVPDALNLGEGFQVGYGYQPRTYGIEIGYKF